MLFSFFIITATIYLCNYEYNQLDKLYYNKAIDALMIELDSVSSMSKYLTDNWEKLEPGETAIIISSIKTSLEKAELSAKLATPHFNIMVKNNSVSTDFISNLFRIYKNEVSEWQNKTMADSGNSKTDLIKSKLNLLSYDFDYLKRINREKLENCTYEELQSLWTDTVNSLKSEEVVKNYKMIYE